MSRMANDRILFVPWPQATGAGFGSDADYNNYYKDQTHHERNWTVVYLDSPHPGGIIANMGTGWGTRLHITGHGAAGVPNITDPNDANPVSYQALVAALMTHGFKKYYTGTVVIDSCDSALGTPSFAKLVARELWNQGYKLTCAMGFKGSLQNGYVDLANGGIAGKFRHRIVTKADGTNVKSKDACERFFGP
jgi:hypothetical protein